LDRIAKFDERPFVCDAAVGLDIKRIDILAFRVVDVQSLLIETQRETVGPLDLIVE